MIYIRNNTATTAKSATYLGNVGSPVTQKKLGNLVCQNKMKFLNTQD